MQLLATSAIESEELATAGFRRQLEQHRAGLATARTDADVQAVAGPCLEACEAYLTGARTYLAGCESELAEVLSVLRQALAGVAGDSREFDREMQGSTERLGRIVKLDDIRQLKREIRVELARMERTLVDRREHEERRLARLSAKIESLEQSLVQARDEAHRDGLTGVGNRRAFDITLGRLLSSADSPKRRLVLALIDIDDFKAINDTHGHQVGDRVLVCVADLFQNGLRSNDLIARFGGEEFALLMRGITLDKAKKRLEEIRSKLALSYEYETAGEHIDLGFTYSCGVTEIAPGDTADSLIRRADEALYAAKRKARTASSCAGGGT